MPGETDGEEETPEIVSYLDDQWEFGDEELECAYCDGTGEWYDEDAGTTVPCGYCSTAEGPEHDLD